MESLSINNSVDLNYKSIKDSKTCYFCGNNKHAKRYRFWTHNYKAKYWICFPCIESKGGTKAVLQELEKIHLPQKETTFFKNKIQLSAVIE